MGLLPRMAADLPNTMTSGSVQLHSNIKPDVIITWIITVSTDKDESKMSLAAMWSKIMHGMHLVSSL